MISNEGVKKFTMISTSLYNLQALPLSLAEKYEASSKVNILGDASKLKYRIEEILIVTIAIFNKN